MTYESSLLSFHCRKSMLNAIPKQHAATQGLFLSPIRAHFQKTPGNPVLLRSNILGVTAWI